MNTVQITGRLTRDPELRSLPSGTSVCQMRLAVEGMGRGDRQTVGYINVSAFGAPGEAAARTLTKGWLVAVNGRLESHEWTGQNDIKRYEHAIVGTVEFLAAPKDKTDTPDTANAPQTNAGSEPVPTGAAA